MAHAQPATQACLEPLERVLSCPEGTQLVDQREKKGGAAFCAIPRGVDHWPPASRNGPSLWYRDGQHISRAGRYKDHNKHGRHYYFDKKGRLERLIDWQDDDFHGLYVECHENGAVKSVMRHRRGGIVGLVRRWDAQGRVRSISRYEHGKYVGRVRDPSARRPPPEALCRPKHCDLGVQVGSGAK